MVGSFGGEMWSVVREHKHPVALLPFAEKKSAPFLSNYFEPVVTLTRNALHRLSHLITWAPVGDTVWGGLEGGALLKKVCHWGRALRVHSLTPLPVPSLLLCAWG